VRAWGRCIALGLAALLTGCTDGRLLRTDAADRAVADRPAVQVADGVYMVRGTGGEADATNRGRIGNTGFIVGDRGVVVIDVGVSHRHAVALLDAIRRVTDKPVVLAIVTHVHQEFLFGAAAFRERGIPIRMQRSAAELMAARCTKCLTTLRRLLGEDEMRDTAMFTPDQVFDNSHTFDAIGRPVRVLHFGHSSGPGDIAVFDERSGVLFAGGLMEQQRIPDVQDSQLPGWRAALDAIEALPVSTVVPGHGPASSPGLIATTRRYLDRLDARVRQLVTNGAALSEVPDASGLDEFRSWDQYDTIHRRNASILFVRVEREVNFK
jgi:glyoxylase-like metal-dependent hydrolase (beta-lactamase superfamily II)